MKNILVVDDNVFVAEGLAVRLNLFVKDCRVLTAVNGADAVQVLSATEVDFVLTDLQMPVMSGYELITYCREHRPRVRLAAMTGDCSPDVRKRLQALGVSVCFEKPFDYDLVAQRVRDELDSSSAFDRLFPRSAAAVAAPRQLLPKLFKR
jgi:CheY-like chemotaxis protein